MATYNTAHDLQQVLSRMAELAESDEALIKASRGRTLTMGYEFPDLDVFFLTMDSDIFDGMFTGKVNAAKAAMKGDLAFSGNVAAAMRLQGLMDDFKRLYLQAKGEAGS
jgi:putative sterol carrier protein